MAQIREFESTTESYFILDGVSYPKVYEAMLDNGYSDTKIKLVGTNRDTTPLVFSTEYTNILVDGEDFDTASEAISRLNQVVFSKGGGSGGGGTTGDYIPLSGTEVGKPVTGDLSFKSEFGVGYMELNPEGIVFNGSQFEESGDSNLYLLRNRFNLYTNTDENSVGLQYNFSNDRPADPEAIIIYRIDESNLNFRGMSGSHDFTNLVTDLDYIQKLYVDKQHSYSETEYKTGGKWIDDKDIYTITQLTARPAPTVDTMIKSTVVGGTYTEYEYTKP